MRVRLVQKDVQNEGEVGVVTMRPTGGAYDQCGRLHISLIHGTTSAQIPTDGRQHNIMLVCHRTN